jgi:hypothetical protein
MHRNEELENEIILLKQRNKIEEVNILMEE